SYVIATCWKVLVAMIPPTVLMTWAFAEVSMIFPQRLPSALYSFNSRWAPIWPPLNALLKDPLLFHSQIDWKLTSTGLIQPSTVKPAPLVPTLRLELAGMWTWDVKPLKTNAWP